jgi:hypothetical protein
MSQHDEPGERDRDDGDASGQDSVDAVGESKEVASVDRSRATEVIPDTLAANLTVETLNRYLAVAADDREAAEERSAEVIARFTKLAIAMMCVTMVIAGANVAMIIRQSSGAQPQPGAAQSQSSVAQAAAAVLPRPVESPTVPMAIVPPAPSVLPATPPPEPRETPRPAEKIPLLGSPPTARVKQLFAPGPPRLARTAPARPQPLLSARSVDVDSNESTSVERW